MQDPAGPAQTAGAFVALRPRRPRVALPPGCLTLLGGPLMACGLWQIGLVVFARPDALAARGLLGFGLAFAAVSAAIFFVRMRRTLSALTPVPDVSLEGGHRLTPGAIVPMRIRLRAAARLARLKITLVCERRYVDQETTPGTMSVTPVERIETLTTQDLFEETGLSLNRRILWEKTASVVVPYLAKPSGPVLPSGTAEWYIDVLTEPSIGKAVHDRYDLVVVLSDAPDTPLQPETPGARPGARAAPATLDRIGPAVGCAVLALAFLLAGPILPWFFFSGIPARRGNLLMALAVGILFAGLVLAGVSLLVHRAVRPDNWKGRTHDPRRLP